MKRAVILFCILLGTLNIFGQSDTNVPKPEAIPTPEFKNTQEEDFQRRTENVEQKTREMRFRSILSQNKLSKEEKEAINKIITPHPDDLTKYKDFLKQSKTGIFRLLPDYGCESKYIVRVDEHCENHISGKWAYSFRMRDYSNEYFHDIWFADGNLISNGLLSQGVLTSLGNVSLQDVSLSNNELKYLIEFEPATDKDDVKSQYQMISKGFEKNGFYYSNKINFSENETYALRIIAYKIKDKFISRFSRKNYDKLTADDEKFSLLRFDKRKDSIIVFRVIRKSDDGGMTILWRELKKKKSPKIIFEKQETLADFKN